jgi:hypothetical protein
MCTAGRNHKLSQQLGLWIKDVYCGALAASCQILHRHFMQKEQTDKYMKFCYDRLNFTVNDTQNQA